MGGKIKKSVALSAKSSYNSPVCARFEDLLLFFGACLLQNRHYVIDMMLNTMMSMKAIAKGG